jgi:hypothetical protein
MKNVDVVIISWAKDDYLKDVTKKGLDSLFQSESEEIAFHAYVIESNPLVDYNEYQNIGERHTCTTIHPEDKIFGYNKYLNIGVNQGKSEYVALCNNDLVYEKNWASEIIKVMDEFPDLLSASPWCPQTQGDNKNHEGKTYIGYRIRVEVAGWCIFQNREIYQIIEKLDESLTFWYSDNIYSDEIRIRGIKHGLVANSLVNHHENNIGKTCQTLESETIRSYTTEESKIYTRRIKELTDKFEIQ